MISQYTQKTYRITYIEPIRQGVLKAEGNNVWIMNLNQTAKAKGSPFRKICTEGNKPATVQRVILTKE